MNHHLGHCSEDNLSAILYRLWHHRRVCFLGVATGFIVSLLIGLLLKPQYQITMIVAPYEIAADFHEFVDDIGTPVPRGMMPTHSDNKNFIRFLQSVRGAKVAGLLYRMEDIRSGIADSGAWRVKGYAVTTPADMVTYLERHIGMEPIGATQSMRITYRHPDPVFGTTLLRALTKANDQMIKGQDKSINAARIEWLKDSLKKTFNPDHRQALARLLLSEERRAMVLGLDEAYTYQIIEGAAASGRPVTPDFSLFLPLGMLFGFLGSAFIVMLREGRS